MAYTDFTPETEVQESQYADAFKIWDKSEWNGESGNTTSAYIEVIYTDEDGEETTYDPYYLIDTAGSTDLLDEYLSDDGLTVYIDDLTIDGESAEEKFTDGYYIIKTVYNDGSYDTGNEPNYQNQQAFLARVRATARKLPAKLLSWPITDAVRRKNWDVFMVRSYLESAENAVDLGKTSQFRTIMGLINNMFDTYEIEEVW